MNMKVHFFWALAVLDMPAILDRQVNMDPRKFVKFVKSGTIGSIGLVQLVTAQLVI